MSFYYTFTAESDSERILNFGQHLPKLWAIKYRVFFLWNTVYYCHTRVVFHSEIRWAVEMQTNLFCSGVRPTSVQICWGKFGAVGLSADMWPVVPKILFKIMGNVTSFFRERIFCYLNSNFNISLMQIIKWQSAVTTFSRNDERLEIVGSLRHGRCQRVLDRCDKHPSPALPSLPTDSPKHRASTFTF